jgi:hypothetical protein
LDPRTRLYYPNEFDKAFTPILSSNDKGESPTNGALLVAPYGKGYYIYTGLSCIQRITGRCQALTDFVEYDFVKSAS